MKALILTFVCLVLSNFSFSHEMTLRQVTADREKAEKEEKKLCSKRDVICKMGDYKSANSKQSIQYSRAERSAQNNWFIACRQSKKPSIVSNRKSLDEIKLRIDNLLTNSIVGQEFRALDKKVKKLNLSRRTAKTKEDRDLYHRWGNARMQWSSMTNALYQARIQRWDDLYGEAGSCGRDTRDPEVYRAYETYQTTKSNCHKAELACLSKGDEVMELISAENGLMRQEGQFELSAFGPDHTHPNKEGGSVK